MLRHVRTIPGVHRLTLALMLAATTLLSGCGTSTPVPDVVGIQLNEAYDKLEAASFENLDAADAYEQRAIFLDSNWVVIEQLPKPSEVVDTDTPITLRVGKIGEERTTARLPTDSPVLARIRADQALQAENQRREDAQAAEEQRAAADERRRAATGYVNQIDPAVRIANTTLQELKRLGEQVSSGEIQGDELVANVIAVSDALDRLDVILKANPPGDRADLEREHDALIGAVFRFKQGAQTLLSAEASQRATSMDRFNMVYADAARAWNSSLRAIYAPTGTPPPLLG